MKERKKELLSLIYDGWKCRGKFTVGQYSAYVQSL